MSRADPVAAGELRAPVDELQREQGKAAVRDAHNTMPENTPTGVTVLTLGVPPDRPPPG